MKILKIFSLTILLVFITFIYILLNYFKTSFGYTPKLLVNTIFSAYKQSVKIPKYLNFLILGIDPRDDWLEKSLDTDTIILVTLNFETREIKLVSLPRDLWYPPLDSRINKIYQNSLKETNPLTQTKSTFNDILGLKIDHILILDTSFLAKFIDTLGYVEVNLPYSIVDTKYPDPLHITDPVNFPKPYTTITFQKGVNIIDINNVDYFVRSRKGSDLADGGTDLGRSNRQQLLIMAIFNKLKDKNTFTNLSLVAKLYSLFTHTTKTISDQDLLAIIFKIKNNIFKLKISNITLPVGLTMHDLTGVIYHPETFIGNAWVFLPIENDYTILRQYLDSNLF